MSAPLPPGRTRPADSQPGNRDEAIDWGVHRGSCRIFYAERRCTCSPPPPPTLDPVTCADLLTACSHDGPHVPVGLDGQPTGEVWPAPPAGQDTGQLREPTTTDRVLADGVARIHASGKAAERLAAHILEVLTAVREDAESELDEGRAQVQRVRELHVPLDRGVDPQCQGCATHITFTVWPCPTIRALDGQS